MIELMQRIGFRSFKRRTRLISPHRSARTALRGGSEPLEARMLLAADTLGAANLDTQPANVVPFESFSIFSALSRGGEALMSQAGMTPPLARPSVPSIVPPLSLPPAPVSPAPVLPTSPTPPVAATPAPSEPDDLVLQYVPGEPEFVSSEGIGSVLAAGPDSAEGEPGDVTITIGENVFVVYNSFTGELRVESSKSLSSVEVVSDSGIFTGAPAANLGGPFDVDTDVKVFKLSSLTTGGSAIGFGSISFGAVAQTGLSDDFVRRDLTIAGSLVPSGGVSSKTVRIEIFPSDLNGNRIRDINAGEEFELRATVRDVRSTDFQLGGDVGVFAAYFDVEWNSALARAIGEPEFTSNFSNAQSGTVGVGFLDEVGAISSSTSPTTTNAQLMFTQRMRATGGGVLTFELNEADILPQHETLIFGGTSAVDVTEIAFSDDVPLAIADTPTAPDLAAFAQDLSDAGAVFYGAGWCPACTAQKELFEDGQHFLPFVEVTNPDRTPNDIATENDITSYPTWIFADESRLEGQQTLEALATAAGIEIPQSNAPIVLPIDDVDLLSGSPLHVPLDGYDPNGGPLTYTITSDDPSVVSVEQLSGNRSVMFDVEGFGKMVFEFFEDEAPLAVEQITTLIEDGFYDGLTFHRVLDNFVIQGGDPAGDGTGGSDLPDFDDQFDVDLQHNRTGILSMAKSGDDTNNSQFFITEGTTRHLDFNHTIFGQLIEGESNRENISNTDVSGNGTPSVPVVINSATLFNDTENALLRLSSPEGTTGSANITVTVRDAEGHESTETFAVNVTPDTVNGGPYLEDIPELSTPGNTPLEFQLSAIDVEGDAVEFSGSTNDSNITIEVDESTGNVTVTPADGFIGSATATVRVTSVDPSGTQDRFDSQTITIDVLPGMPTIDLLAASDTGISSTDDITNATELQFEISGVADGAEVDILADGDIIGTATADGSTITITTSNLSALGDGVYEITAVQTSDGQTSDESPAIVLTLDQTDPANFSSTPPTTGVSQELLEFDVDHPEEGASGFRYSLQGAPTGATIDDETGEVAWTPTSGQIGVNLFGVVATDEAGNTRTQDVSIDVASLEIMSVKLVAVDVSGNPLSAIATGQAFNLQVFVQDLRDDSDDLRGVFAAYVDVNFPSAIVDASDTIVYSPSFPNGQFGDTDSEGLVNDAGATANSAPLGLGEFLLMTIPMVAVGAGTADFTSDGADESPLTDSLLTGTSTALQDQQIIFGSTSISVVDLTFAVDDDFEVLEDSRDVSLSVLANDVAVPSTTTLTITNVSGATNGTVSISTDEKSLLYTPDADFSGSDAFSYTIQDDAGNTSTADVSVDVFDVNDDPVAGDDTFSVTEDSADSTLDVLANDSTGPDVGDDLQISSVSAASNGTATIATDGKSIIYTPAGDFNGTDSFTYTLSDGRGGTDTAEVTVTVTEVNDAPIAGRDIRSMNEDTVLTLDVSELLGNDLVGGGESDQTLTVIDVGSATEGTVSLDGNTITYTPPADFFGTVAFEYTVQDNGTTNGQADAKTAVGTVTVNVNNVNDAPTAVDDVAMSQNGAGSLLIDVLSNDTDAPDVGETLTVTAVSDGSEGGTITIANDGQIEYTPADSFSGDETFTYTISDGNGGEDTATVTVNVQNFVPGGVSGNVFLDSNNDGVFSENENWLSGVKVTLSGTDNLGREVDLSVRTDASGRYQFADVAPGDYVVTQRQPTFTVEGINRHTPEPANGSVVKMNGVAYDIALSAEGIGDTQLNFAERSIEPKFSIWEALASSRDDGFHASVHATDGLEWSQVRTGWNGVEVTDVSLNAAKTHVTITIVENGQTLSTTVPRSDRSRIQVIGQEGQNHLVRVQGARSEFDFQPVTS